MIASSGSCRRENILLLLTCPSLTYVNNGVCLLLATYMLLRTEAKPVVVKPLVELQKAATGAAAAAAIASSVLSWAPPPAEASAFSSSSQVVAEKVIREGVYGEYEVDIPEQKYDDARSTFKSAKETKSKKGRFSLVAVPSDVNEQSFV